MGKTIIDGQEVFTSSQMTKNVAYPIDDEYETMQDEINVLNQNLTTIISTNIPNQNPTVSDCVYKQNNIVTITNLDLRGTFNTSVDATILPEGFRPKEDKIFWCNAFINNDPAATLIKIKTDGTIRVYGTSTTFQIIIVNCFFETE